MGGGSQVWKKMLQARDQVKHQIIWNKKRGDVSFWHDNWTELKYLYTIKGEEVEWDDNYKSVVIELVA